VPVFNSPDLLATCLASLRKTEYGGPSELVLVDNASTDPETLRLLRKAVESGEWRAESSEGKGSRPIGRVQRVRFEEPAGFSAAVNAGMKAAEDPAYFVLFNQDCEVIETDWLMWLVNWMEQRAQCAIAGARLLHPDGTIQHAGIWILPNGDAGHLGEGRHGDHPNFQYYERVPAVTGAVFAIRNAFVNREGAFDEEYLFGCEDIEYCLRADVAGQEVWYVANAVVRHDAHGVCRENRSDAERIQRWQTLSHAKFRREWVPLLDAIARKQVGVVVPTVAGREGRAGRALADYLVNCGIETTLFVAHGEAHDLRPGQLHRSRPLSEFTSIDTVVTVGGNGAALSHGLAARQRFDWTCEEALSDRRGCLHKILGAPVGRRDGLAAW
jgi:GT2 family glycosyltransferase